MYKYFLATLGLVPFKMSRITVLRDMSTLLIALNNVQASLDENSVLPPSLISARDDLCTKLEAVKVRKQSIT